MKNHPKILIFWRFVFNILNFKDLDFSIYLVFLKLPNAFGIEPKIIFDNFEDSDFNIYMLGFPEIFLTFCDFIVN